MGRKILFVTYGGGHVDIVARVVRKLEEIEPSIDVSVLALTTAGKFMADLGMHCLGCADFVPVEDRPEVERIGRELSENLWNADSGIPYRESVAYLGVSMLDLIRQYGEDVARSRYAREGRKAFLPVGFADGVISALQPSLIVTTCHVRMERAFVIAGKGKGIKTAMIEDLLGYSLLDTSKSNPVLPKFPKTEWPDYVLVMNNVVRQRHVAAGFPESSIYVTGQPAIASWMKEYSRAVPHDSLNKLRQCGKKTLVYVAPAREDVLLEHSELLFSFSEENSSAGVVIKLHPSVSKERYFELVGVSPRSVTVLAGENILSVIAGADLVVLYRSTVGILCSLAEVPFVVADWGGQPEDLPYVSSGLAPHIASKRDFEETISGCLFGTRQVKLGRGATGLFSNDIDADINVANCLARIV